MLVISKIKWKIAVSKDTIIALTSTPAIFSIPVYLACLRILNYKSIYTRLSKFS